MRKIKTLTKWDNITPEQATMAAITVSYPKEEAEQIKLVTWLSLQGIKHFAIPNGGKRNYKEAARLKRSGVSPGVPDLMIPIPSGGYHGLFIEMKRTKGGKASPQQIAWLQYLRDQGYWADLAHGFDEAKEIVLHYLGLTPRAA